LLTGIGLILIHIHPRSLDVGCYYYSSSNCWSSCMQFSQFG